MELADFIRLAQQEPALSFLIIGGYAVAAHGHTRATFDVDFLVRRAARDQWRDRLTEAWLKLLGESASFAQFNQPDGEAFRPLPPQVSLGCLIQRIRQPRQWFPAGLRTAKERWQAKTDVEFRL